MVVVTFIHPQNICWDICSFSRCCDDNLLSTSLYMFASTRSIDKNPSPLHQITWDGTMLFLHLLKFVQLVKLHNDNTSITMSMPSSAHGSFRGSRLETTMIGLPSTLMVPLSTIFTSALKIPSIESYLRRWDAYKSEKIIISHASMQSIIFISWWFACGASTKLEVQRQASSWTTYILNTAAVIDDDDIKWRVLSSMPAAEEVPTDPSKTIDSHFQLGNCLPTDRAGSKSLMHVTTP